MILKVEIKVSSRFVRTLTKLTYALATLAIILAKLFL